MSCRHRFTSGTILVLDIHRFERGRRGLVYSILMSTIGSFGSLAWMTGCVFHSRGGCRGFCDNQALWKFLQFCSEPRVGGYEGSAAICWILAENQRLDTTCTLTDTRGGTEDPRCRGIVWWRLSDFVQQGKNLPALRFWVSRRYGGLGLKFTLAFPECSAGVEADSHSLITSRNKSKLATASRSFLLAHA